MIRIKVLDEARFNDDANLTTHYLKHVLTKHDGEEQMDAMSKKTLDDLADELTDSKCGDLEDNDEVVGYVGIDGRYSKFDKESHLQAVYNDDEDKTISVYKTNYQKFKNKAYGNGEHKFKSDIPDEEKEKGEVFDYGKFVGSHNVVSRKKIKDIEQTIFSVGILFDDYQGKDVAKFFFPKSYDKNTSKIGKAKIRENLNLKIFTINDEDDLSIDNREDKDGYEVDNLALLLTNYIGKKMAVNVKGVYESEDVKALIFSVPQNSPFNKIVTVDPLVMMVAKTSKGKESTINVKEAKPITMDIAFVGTLYYTNNGSNEFHTAI